MAMGEETSEPTSTAESETYYDFLQLNAPSAILIDAKSGMTLYEKNAY